MAQTTVTSPYASYEFYSDVYLGNSIDEGDFARIELRAEEQLDELTFRRIKTMDESLVNDDLVLNIRKAVCAIAEILADEEERGYGVSSENNDGFSVSYSADVQGEQGKRVRNIAIRYLAYSGLLFRGGGKWYED